MRVLRFTRVRLHHVTPSSVVAWCNDSTNACVCVLQFTVTPVRQSSVNSTGGSGRKRLAVFEIGDDAEPTDTLTQNSITSLLSAKFRVSHALLAFLCCCA